MLISFFSLPDWEDVFIVFKQICLSIDTVIYNAIAWMYSVFMALAGARIFSNDLIDSFVQRMYLIVSIVMLFVVAYSFLNVIINPDNLTKGNSSPTKLVTNIVKALVVIVLVPSAFSFAFSFQKAIVKENIIGKLILGSKKKVNVDDFDTRSADFSVTLFESNFYQVDTDELTTKAYDTASEDARTNNDIGEFSKFLTKNDHKKVQYNFIITGIVGIYVLYTLLIFSIDLGLRVVKLFFYEIIAPVPALLMIVPSQDKAFKSWLKITLKCFADLFIKIAIISFGVYIINLLSEAFRTGGTIVGFESSNQNVIFFARVFIILGVIVFMKKAPKLIEDLFGWKLDENGLSLKKRIDEIKSTQVASAANKVIGAGIGLHYANRARKIGEKARGEKQTFGQSFMTRAGGLINGFRGGIRNAGYAFDYEMTNQQWYSSAEYESMGGIKRTVAGIDNRLRNNVGGPSLYREKEAAIELEYVRKVEPLDREIAAMKKVADERKTKIDATYDPMIERDNAYIKSIKDFEEHCNSKVQKADSDVYVGGIMTAVEVDDFGIDKDGKKVKIGSHWEMKEKDGVGNYSAIQDEIDIVKDNEAISPELRTQIITANTKLQKSLGGIYKDRLERAMSHGFNKDGEYTYIDEDTKKQITVKRDVEFENFKAALDDTIARYDKLGLDENGERAYEVIGSSYKLQDLHGMLDVVRGNNASGKKERAMNEKVEYPDGSKNFVTLYELNQSIKDKEDKKKKESDDKSAQMRVLDGYKRMDDIGKKGFYKGNKN